MARLENLLGAWSLTVTDRMAAVGAAAGLSGTDQAALVTLRAHPDRPVSWLGDVLGLTSSGATRLVDRLVSSGWVGRTPATTAASDGSGSPGRGRRSRPSSWSARGAVLADSLTGLERRRPPPLEEILERLVGASTPDFLPAMRTCRLCDRDRLSRRRPALPARPHRAGGRAPCLR